MWTISPCMLPSCTYSNPDMVCRRWALNLTYSGNCKGKLQSALQDAKIGRASRWRPGTSLPHPTVSCALQSIEEIWDKFREQFTELWDAAVASGKAGDLQHAGLYSPGAGNNKKASKTLKVPPLHAPPPPRTSKGRLSPMKHRGVF